MTLLIDKQQDRINLRLKSSAKRELERAASLEGQTVSRFILNSALEHAKKTINKFETMSLNAQDSETFFNALANPISLNKKLEDAFKEYDQRVSSK